MATEHFASHFVKNNILITSGMAYGIDSISHRAAINNGGTTYAVIASGLDKIQPKLQHKFAEDIVNSGGAIISEYKFGTSSWQGNFLQRNRIIAGISKATLIVESAYKGGALNTANLADHFSRPVFVIPGPIFSEKSTGTNNLIHKNKASIAVSPQQLLKDIGISEEEIAATKPNLIKFNSHNEEIIYKNLTYEPIHIDALSSATNLDISEVLVALLELEFEGLVRQLPGKHYCLEINK
jgi:DNA processing protein